MTKKLEKFGYRHPESPTTASQVEKSSKDNSSVILSEAKNPDEKKLNFQYMVIFHLDPSLHFVSFSMTYLQ
jgi:hypothetical protein